MFRTFRIPAGHDFRFLEKGCTGGTKLCSFFPQIRFPTQQDAASYWFLQDSEVWPNQTNVGEHAKTPRYGLPDAVLCTVFSQRNVPVVKELHPTLERRVPFWDCKGFGWTFGLLYNATPAHRWCDVLARFPAPHSRCRARARFALAAEFPHRLVDAVETAVDVAPRHPEDVPHRMGPVPRRCRHGLRGGLCRRPGFRHPLRGRFRRLDGRPRGGRL